MFNKIVIVFFISIFFYQTSYSQTPEINIYKKAIVIKHPNQYEDTLLRLHGLNRDFKKDEFETLAEYQERKEKYLTEHALEILIDINKFNNGASNGFQGVIIRYKAEDKKFRITLPVEGWGGKYSVYNYEHIKILTFYEKKMRDSKFRDWNNVDTDDISLGNVIGSVCSTFFTKVIPPKRARDLKPKLLNGYLYLKLKPKDGYYTIIGSRANGELFAFEIVDIDILDKNLKSFRIL